MIPWRQAWNYDAIPGQGVFRQIAMVRSDPGQSTGGLLAEITNGVSCMIFLRGLECLQAIFDW